MLLNKRGVSDVVTTILLVLLAIVAVAVVAGFIIPFVQNTLKSGTECLKYNDYFKFQENFNVGLENYKYNCHQGNLYGISVSANGDAALADNIQGFSVALEGTGSSETARVEDNTMNNHVHMLGQASPITLSVPKTGEIKTYVYDSMNTFNKMKIYAVLKSGRTCDMSDEIDIIPCYGVTLG